MVEAGVKGQFWNGRVQATLAGYDITKNNLLAPTPGNPTVSQQIGQQSSRGIEAQLNAALDYGFTLEVNATVLRAKFDEFAENVGGVRIDRAGHRPTNVPNATANGFVTWRHGPLTLRSGLRYVSERYTNNANTLALPSYIAVDAGIRYAVNDRVYVDLNAANLTNAYYATSSSNAGTQWIMGRPRMVELTLHGRF
jgi:iron complex outermembrane receptor protein